MPLYNLDRRPTFSPISANPVSVCIVDDVAIGQAELTDIRRRIQENTLESLQEAVRLSPTNGLAFAKLALRILAQDLPKRAGGVNTP